MRQIFQMVLDVAHEVNAPRLTPEVLNERMARMQEAYNFLDHNLQRPDNVDPVQAREAMVIADFPNYFGVAISRAFYAAYKLRTGSWRDYTFKDVVPDFRQVERYRVTEFETLVPRAELGEVKQTQVSDSKLAYGAKEYARGYGLSWRTIVNDDLGEVQTFPTKLLRACSRFEDAYVSNLYDNAVTKAGLIALGANYADTTLGGPPTVANVKKAYELFMARVDAQGNPITIVPRFIVTSPIHELTVREILSGIDPTSGAPAVKRVTAGLLEWRGDPYIGNTDEWYLIADPADIPTITVARLRGMEEPQLFMKAPNAVPLSPSGGLGTPSWTTGSFETGEISFMIDDIIGGWEDATYQGVTDYQGLFLAY